MSLRDPEPRWRWRGTIGLVSGAAARVLLIGCTDALELPRRTAGARVVLLTPGNVVPPTSEPLDAVAVEVERAVAALGVEEVIVCGHAGCAAARRLLAPAARAASEDARWRGLAEETRRRALRKCPDPDPELRLAALVREGVLVQLERLRRYPVIAAALEDRRLALSGWVHAESSGRLYTFDAACGRFLLLESSAPERGWAGSPAPESSWSSLP